MSVHPRLAVFLLAFLLASAYAPATVAGSAEELAGLWTAKRWFGPMARGPLVIEREDSSYRADMMGWVLPVRVNDGELSFELPNDQGEFRGRLQPGGKLHGHWYPPRTLTSGRAFQFASPVWFERESEKRWSAEVLPFDDVFTFHLRADARPDGSVAALLFNPERDWGAQIGVERLVREGDVVRLVSNRTAGDPERSLASGTYDAASEILTLDFPGRGGSFDFRRDGEQSDYYPRGKDPGRYTYRPPPARDDGWSTATLDEVNIDRATVETLIQLLIDTRPGSKDTPKVHALLVARHGKLVLEEYFYGEHREKLHDTRSAAKSVTATVIGAAMQAGAPLALDTSVYKTMNGGTYPAGLEARKRAMTLEHLLTMSSGYFCDDTNPEAPGNEEGMLDQSEEPDYYRYTLRVPMASRPGEKAVYCSANPNLALGVMGRALNESPLDTFDRLIAGPLKITRYGWFLDPAGQPYGGGGVQILARDFMKFGQLMLDGGTWHGQRILGKDFVARAGGRLYHLRRFYYGYQWWSLDYPYKTRTVAAFAAGGAGGQSVIVIPELDLVIATHGGNYSSTGTYYVQLTLTPRYLLPAVREAGDDPSVPVYPREYYQPRLGSPTESGPVKSTQ